MKNGDKQCALYKQAINKQKVISQTRKHNNDLQKETETTVHCQHGQKLLGSQAIKVTKIKYGHIICGNSKLVIEWEK